MSYDNHGLKPWEDVAIAAVGIAGIGAAAELAPRLGFAFGGVESSAVDSTSSRARLLADLHPMQTSDRLLEGTGTALGGDIQGGSKVLSLADFQAQMARQGLGIEDVASAMNSNNLINFGRNSDVFRIPEIPDYVLRLHRGVALGADHLLSVDGLASRAVEESDMKLLPVEDPAPNINFGLPVAKLGDQIEVLKRLGDEPYGANRIVKNDSQAMAALHESSVRTAAAWPQEAYDHLANQLKQAGEHGLQFDHFNPNNVVIDHTTNLPNPLDFQMKESPVQHSFMDIYYPLVYHHVPVPSELGTEASNAGIAGSAGLVGHPLQAEYRAILDKSLIGAKNAGLDVGDLGLPSSFRSAAVTIGDRRVFSPGAESAILFRDAGVSAQESEQMLSGLSGKAFRWPMNSEFRSAIGW